MDSLIFLLYPIAMVVTITIVLLIVNAIAARKQGVPAFDVDKKDYGKATVLLILTMLCIILVIVGLILLVVGIAQPQETKYDTEKCSWCEGDGRLLDKSCSYCDGKGYIITQDSFRFGPVLGVFVIAFGGVGYFVCYSQMQNLKRRRFSAPRHERIQPKPHQAAMPNNSRADVKELELYKSLLDMGVITKEEFNEKKKQIFKR